MKNHAADQEIGFLAKLILKPYGHPDSVEVEFEKIEKNLIHPRSQKLFRIHHFQRRKGQHNE